MQIKVKKEIEETVEVETPYYCEYGDLAMVISENKVITINPRDYSLSSMLCGEHFVQRGTPIAKSVFDNAAQKALTNLNNLLFPKPDNVEEEEMYMWHQEDENRKMEEHYSIEHNHLND